MIFTADTKRLAAAARRSNFITFAVILIILLCGFFLLKYDREAARGSGEHLYAWKLDGTAPVITLIEDNGATVIYTEIFADRRVNRTTVYTDKNTKSTKTGVLSSESFDYILYVCESADIARIPAEVSGRGSAPAYNLMVSTKFDVFKISGKGSENLDFLTICGAVNSASVNNTK